MSEPLPHDPRVEAFIERVSATAWLRPDAALDALDPAAVEWARDRVEEHLAALAPFAAEPFSDPVVEVARDVVEAEDRWTDAWEALSAPTPYTAALNSAFYATAVDRNRADVPERLRAALYAEQEALATRLAAAVNRTNLAVGVPDWSLPPRPAMVYTATLALAWLRLRGDAPSPWAPLLALWERGAWPLPLPDATMLLFVRVGGAPAPARLPSSRRPYPAMSSTAIPPLSLLGLNGLPHTWTRLPEEPVAPVGPPPPPPVMLAGAVAPVMPFPPPEPILMGNPPPVRDERPWYKRLFGR